MEPAPAGSRSNLLPAGCAVAQLDCRHGKFAFAIAVLGLLS